MRKDCSADRKNEHPGGARSAASVTTDSEFVVFVQEKAIHVISGNADHSTKTHAATPKRVCDILRDLIAIGALVLGLMQAPDTRADSASCLVKVSAYVAELDELLSKERNWNTPYMDLTKRNFPIYDCEVDALLAAVRESHFIRSISYHARTNQYFILFSNGDADASFAYLASEKKSNAATAGLSHK
jgi:hypothetical protein